MSSFARHDHGFYPLNSGRQHFLCAVCARSVVNSYTEITHEAPQALNSACTVALIFKSKVESKSSIKKKLTSILMPFSQSTFAGVRRGSLMLTQTWRHVTCSSTASLALHVINSRATGTPLALILSRPARLNFLRVYRSI